MKKTGDEFLFGAVYVIEQEYTDDEIRRDLKNMHDVGFNLITIWPVGNAWLAKSSHEWVFDRTRFVLDVCQSLGMKAIMQLIGQNHSMEFLPDAAMTEDMEIQNVDGKLHAGIWCNLNHPTVRSYIDTFFREAITQLKDHPAVYGWDVYNEAHFHSDDPWTVRLYQEWLQKKYGTIQHLNLKWYRRYEDFSQIRPRYRRAGYSVWSSLLPAVDFEKFRSENLTDICRFLCDTARKYDDGHPVILDGTSAGIVSGDLTQRNNDENETAYLPDIYGSTFYPKSWGRNYKETPWTLSMYLSIPAGAARCAGKPYFVSELQTHTQSALTPGSEVSCHELVSWTLMCIFTGLSGMQLWRWRPFLHGYQVTGRGLTQMDGTPNERAAAMGQMMNMIRRNRDLFDTFTDAEPEVQIALGYEERLFFDSLFRFDTQGANRWSENAEGWYKYFWNKGLNVGIADLTRLETCMSAKLLIVPGAVRLTEREADAMRRYVENGGTLIADGRVGALDRWGCVPAEGIPGKALSELFGVVETDVESDHAMDLEGKKLPVGFMSQVLKVTGPSAQVLCSMETGTPAVVMNRFGKGRAILFNSFEGLALLENIAPERTRLIDRVTGNLWNMTFEKDSQVHVSMIENETKRAILVVNFSDQPQTVTVHGLKDGTVVTELFTESKIIVKQTSSIVLNTNSYGVYAYEK